MNSIDKNEVIENISEIQSMLERKVEWLLNEHLSRDELNPVLRVINAKLLELQLMAENS